MIELIDMGSCELFGGGLRRLGYNNFGDAMERAKRLIKIGSLSQDHAAIKRSGGRLIVAFSEAGEQRAVAAARAFGGSFVTFQVFDDGAIDERWYYKNAATGEILADGPVRWESLVEANIETMPGGMLLDLDQL